MSQEDAELQANPDIGAVLNGPKASGVDVAGDVDSFISDDADLATSGTLTDAQIAAAIRREDQEKKRMKMTKYQTRLLSSHR